MVAFSTQSHYKPRVIQFADFMKWGEIVEILDDQFLNANQIEGVWTQVHRPK